MILILLISPASSNSQFFYQADCERLQSELQQCQETLKSTRAENVRRQKAMQSMQEKISRGEIGDSKSELDAERTARENAEIKLQQAKGATSRKDSIIK